MDGIRAMMRSASCLLSYFGVTSSVAPNLGPIAVAQS